MSCSPPASPPARLATRSPSPSARSRRGHHRPTLSSGSIGSTCGLTSCPIDLFLALDAVLQAPTPPELVQVALRRFKSVVDFSHGGYFEVLVRAHDELHLQYEVDGQVLETPAIHSGLHSVIQSRKAVFVEDYPRDVEGFEASVDLAFVPAPYLRRVGEAGGDIFAMLLPLIDTADGSVIGIVQLLRVNCHKVGSIQMSTLPAFSEEDFKLACLFFSSVSHALCALEQRLQSEQIVHDARRTKIRTQVVLDFAGEIASELSVPNVVERIVDKSRSMLACDRCSLFLLDDIRNELYTTYAMGLTSLRIPLSSPSIASITCREKRAINVRDCYQDKHFNSEVDEATGYHTKALLSVPMRRGGKMLGVIQFINRYDGEPFDALDEEFALFISDFCGIALSNAFLYSEVVKQRERGDMVMEFAKSVGSNLDVNVVLRKVMEKSRSLVGADRCSVFLVDHAHGQVVSKFLDGDSNMEIRVPIGRGIVGVVAETGETINVPEAYADPRFNKEIDSKTGYRTHSILTMPIYNEKEIIGVAQMINKLGPEGGAENCHFSDSDEDLFAVFSTFCGIALRNSLTFNEMATLQHKFQTLVELTLILADESSSSAAVMSTVMRHAASLVEADRFSLFEVDHANKQLVTKLSEDLGELRLPWDSGIVGQVAMTGQERNVTDVSRDPHFNSDVDARTGYRTRNLVALPVRDPDSGEVTMVAEMVNKASGVFGEEDLALLRAFTKFCALSNRKLEPRIVFQSPLSHLREVYFVDQEIVDSMRSWDFDHTNLSEDQLIGLVVAMFDQLGLIHTFGISTEKLYRFVAEVSKHYHRDVIYHNFRHAFDVTHALYYYLTEGGVMEMEAYSPLDAFTNIIAALCHDINHQGYTNTFMSKSDTPFSSLYTSGSIMETHHASIAISILSNPEFNILSSLDHNDTKLVWKNIVAIILATDPAKDKEYSAKFEALHREDAFDPVHDSDHKVLFMCMLMKWSDLCSCTKPFEIAKRWGRLIIEEFFKQGDEERERGLDVMPLFDRTKVKFVSTQIGFGENVALPTFELMAKAIPKLAPVTESLRNNIATYKELEASGQTE